MAALILAGCAKNIENREAVQSAVTKYVSTHSGINVDQMDVNVTNVTFHDNNADATVAFVPKGSPAGSGVTFKYQLERVKDEWEVKSRSGMENAHTGTGGSELPGKQGTAGEKGAMTNSPDGHSMPTAPGHPPLDGAYGRTPENAPNKPGSKQ